MESGCGSWGDHLVKYVSIFVFVFIFENYFYRGKLGDLNNRKHAYAINTIAVAR